MRLNHAGRTRSALAVRGSRLAPTFARTEMNGVLKAALIACMAIGPAISLTAAAQDGSRYDTRSHDGGYAGRGLPESGYSEGGQVERGDRGYGDRGYGDGGQVDSRHADAGANAKHYWGDRHRYDGYRYDRHRYDDHRYGGYRYSRHDHSDWRQHRYSSHYQAPVYHYGSTPGYFEVYPSHRYRSPARYVYPSGYRSYSWRVGHHLPRPYYAPTYYVDYRAYGLAPPPYGHHWVRVDNDVLLVAIATGLVADVLSGIFY